MAPYRHHLPQWNPCRISRVGRQPYQRGNQPRLARDRVMSQSPTATNASETSARRTVNREATPSRDKLVAAPCREEDTEQALKGRPSLWRQVLSLLRLCYIARHSLAFLGTIGQPGDTNGRHRPWPVTARHDEETPLPARRSRWWRVRDSLRRAAISTRFARTRSANRGHPRSLTPPGATSVAGSGPPYRRARVHADIEGLVQGHEERNGERDLLRVDILPVHPSALRYPPCRSRARRT